MVKWGGEFGSSTKDKIYTELYKLCNQKSKTVYKRIKNSRNVVVIIGRKQADNNEEYLSI